MTVTTLKAGDVNVTAQATTGAAWNAPVTTFTGDTATAQIGNITVSKTTAIADGVDSITYTGTVIDANSNPVAGVTAEWSVSPATGKLSATTSTSDIAGKVTVALTSTEVENYVVTAEVNGNPENAETVTLPLTPDRPPSERLRQIKRTISPQEETLSLLPQRYRMRRGTLLRTLT
ncbi:TPA: Ig-like domain-containing protein [Salmonella enterica subsp. enterica serovar Panama]